MHIYRELLPWEGEWLCGETRFRLGILPFAKPVLGLLQRGRARRASMLNFCNECHDMVASNTTTAGGRGGCHQWPGGAGAPLVATVWADPHVSRQLHRATATGQGLWVCLQLQHLTRKS